MASNLVVARGGVEYVPPLSLAFWRWVTVFVILLPFTFSALAKNIGIVKKEYKQLFFLGAMGCGVCGAFPFLAGETTTITNMGIIYTSSPVFIIIISYFFFNEKINLTKFVGLVSCLIGVFAIIIKGDVNLLLSLKFTVGDLWMLGAAIGWALYSIYLFILILIYTILYYNTPKTQLLTPHLRCGGLHYTLARRVAAAWDLEFGLDL